MLDTITKKRIDDCRDILVGKLPDPKAQIEQITIGLIYKFMDDMDREAIELGGKAKFFSDDYEKYSWDSLFDSKVTAIEMLNLYSEAILSMDKNPNIPPLFRDMFKNAFLPYRDPETLKLFLKTIGEFEYTHSEKLGDAFEYLLSVMGSQGDPGSSEHHVILSIFWFRSLIRERMILFLIRLAVRRVFLFQPLSILKRRIIRN
ncbi:MAG: hypothetical protein PF518_18185 [Spirochaetaceae bacterium]|jgi:type I restriction enzyme M protein|nr:hypothetical protein [Spirochaetaceae bacterium]